MHKHLRWLTVHMDCEPPVAPCLLVLYACCWLDEIPVCRSVVKVLLVMGGLKEVCLHYPQHPQPLVIGLQLQTHPVCSTCSTDTTANMGLALAGAVKQGLDKGK